MPSVAPLPQEAARDLPEALKQEGFNRCLVRRRCPDGLSEVVFRATRDLCRCLECPLDQAVFNGSKMAFPRGESWLVIELLSDVTPATIVFGRKRIGSQLDQAEADITACLEKFSDQEARVTRGFRRQGNQPVLAVAVGVDDMLIVREAKS